MPYDIDVFRGERDAPAPLSAAEVLAVLRGTRSPDPDGTEWRVWSEQTPWFVARLDKGVLTLSASYTNPDFLPLLQPYGAEAARIGAALGARVVEEVGGEEVTVENAATVYAETGALVRQLFQTTMGAWASINQDAKAPLDFPVGPFDLVDEYFMFHIRDAPDTSVRAVRAALTAAYGRHRVRDEGPEATSVLAPHEPVGFWKRLLGGAPRAPGLVKVLARSDNVVQIWPWWDQDLSAHGPLGVDIARRLHAALGGTLTLDGVPFAGDVPRAVDMLLGGARTDLWLFARAMIAAAEGLEQRQG